MGLSGGTQDVAPRPEFSWVGPAARAAGTVVHGELERLTGESLEQIHFASRRPRYASQLRQLGVLPTEADRLSAVIATRFSELTSDPVLQWLLSSAHAEANSELRLSGLVEGTLRSVIIDRTFVDADGLRWVIDYKTSTHAGGGLEDFLDAELKRYQSQLELYCTLAGRLGPQPVRAALYFPWLGRLKSLG
jgi:RecB family exonuclease